MPRSIAVRLPVSTISSVSHKLMESQTDYLAANRVEAGEHDGLGSVVDYNLNACGSLEGTDVAALATDDAALDFIAVDMEHRDGILYGRLSCQSLYRLHDDALGLLVGRHFGLVHYIVDIGACSGLGFILERLDKFLLGLFA